jgi:TetR/AcrR family transcriptional repressor of nem operon
MAERSQTRDRILRVGAEIVHRRGFNNTGIQEILRGAEVPKGSFYFYFRSKSDFGLQLIDYYQARLTRLLEKHLAREDLPPVERLLRYFRELRGAFESDACRGGCPVGNMAQEMGDLDEAFRQRLERAFRSLREEIRGALVEATGRGELNPERDTSGLADFILSTWQGAILQMKVDKSTAPLERFETIVFGELLSER